MASASSSSEIITNDGPVLNLINKRLRALRKKLNRISQMEDSVSQGKILNKEQEETLRSKSTVLGAVDELEKLRQPLMQSVSQEIELALEKKQQKPNAVQPTETTKVESAAAAVSAAVEAGSKSEVVDDAAVSDLLNLLYLASVFDVQTLLRAHDNMVTRMHERACCLTYDYVGDDDAAGDPLKEWDLDLIAMLGGLLVSRPVNSSSSHKNALQKCVEHAKLWLANADQPIEPESNITYAGLREKLNKIMASDYFITTPEMKAPVEVAASGGNYTSFQVPVQGAMVPPVSMTVPVEGSAVEYQQEEEHSPDSHNTGNYVNENGHVEEHNQGEQEVENTSENPPQTEQAIPDVELDQHSREFDSKEQHPTRKSYQNYRGNGRGGAGGGGGRRGYGNSRGGGRGGTRGGNQFYDQAGGYYGQRSGYNYRGRGGRGGMGGGNYGYHHGPAGQAQEAS